MEENDKDPEKGRGKAAGVRIFLQIRCPVGVALWCVDVGGYPSYGTGPGGVPRPGGVATDEADTTAEVGWEMGLNLVGGGKRGGRDRANGNLYSEKAEYGRAVYCDADDSGPVSGGREEVGGTGMDEVVGTGGT